MRIYIAGILQETNTFCPVLTDIGFYKRGYFLKENEIIEKLTGTNTEIGGFLNILNDMDTVETVPGVAAWAVTSGKISAEALDILLSELLDGLKHALPVDGVLLALHGALVSETEDDCEGYILGKVRKITGESVPVVCTLDYHASLTSEMINNADILVGYRTYPHIDFKETGERAAKIITDFILNKGRKNVIFKRLPLILPVENTETSSGPLKSVMESISELDEDPGVVCSSLFCPQPWLDVKENGVSVLIYTRNEINSCYESFAQNTVNYIWDIRKDFFLKFPDIDSSLTIIADFEKPVILVDSGDITSAGGVGDSTEVLRSILNKGVKLSTILSIVDPDTVNEAVDIGVGNIGNFWIGGKKDFGYNVRTCIKAQVVRISNDEFEVKGSSFSGLKINMGRRVLLNVNETVHIIVTEYSAFAHDPEFIRSMGINPEEADIIVQKYHKLFRPAYKDIVKTIMIIDTPGFTDMNIGRLPFKKIKRPVYPLDDFNEF